ncbi:MAG: hypothetical protein WBX03_00495 [Terriglobales bacterium]
MSLSGYSLVELHGEGLHEGGSVVSRKWFLLATSFRAPISGAEE